MPADSKAMLEEYRRDANPARAYLLENYAPANNGEYIVCETLYREYATWCKDKNYHPLADRTFGKEVHRAFPAVERKRTGGRDVREWAYDGLVSYVAQVTFI
jgi:phage/plasmid-associated DNA primase